MIYIYMSFHFIWAYDEVTSVSYWYQYELKTTCLQTASLNGIFHIWLTIIATAWYVPFYAETLRHLHEDKKPSACWCLFREAKETHCHGDRTDEGHMKQQESVLAKPKRWYSKSWLLHINIHEHEHVVYNLHFTGSLSKDRENFNLACIQPVLFYF